MEQTECVVLTSMYPTGNFFKFERAFYEQLKEIADKQKILFTYVSETHMTPFPNVQRAHFDVIMKCGADHAEALVNATRSALQKLNGTPSTQDVDMQAKQVLKEGRLTLNGREKPLVIPMPDHVLFAGIVGAHRDR